VRISSSLSLVVALLVRQELVTEELMEVRGKGGRERKEKGERGETVLLILSRPLGFGLFDGARPLQPIGEIRVEGEEGEGGEGEGRREKKSCYLFSARCKGAM